MNDRPWVRQYPSQVPASVGPIPDVNAYELLAGAAERHPRAPALAWFGRHLSYAELEHECRRLSAGLAALGVRRGDRVALILPNCPQYVIAYFAALRLGAIAVGNNPLYTQRELAHQLQDADPSVVVVLDALYEAARPAIEEAEIPTTIVTEAASYLGFPKKQLAPLKLRRDAAREHRPWPPVPRGADVTRWRDVVGRSSTTPPVAQVDAENDVAALVYTGGTTGVAKGAMLTHRNLVANAMQCAAWFLDTADGRESIMSVLPFFHCYGMTVCMNLAVLIAAKSILVPRFDLPTVLKLIRTERPSLFPGVPKIYFTINEAAGDGRHRLSSIRYCLSGAGGLSGDVAERFEQLTGGRVAEGYGLTEAAPVVAGNPLDGTGQRGTIGVALPDTDVRVVDVADPSRDVGVGREGELLVRGPQVMAGYWRRPEETDSVLHDGWLRTGDLVVMGPDGYLRLVDRLKDVIKVSGYNVYPSEVEAVLIGHPKVAKACVLGVPDGHGGEMIKAFVVLRPGETCSPQDIVDWCGDPRSGLAGFRVPRAVEFRDSLPETLIGKVLRRKLQEEERRKVHVVA